MTSGAHLLSRYHRHGDADAFCALVRDHAGMVFATAKRVVGDAALAEDVTQETFLELARKGHDAVESVAAWLHRVAWRKACNAVRSEARRRQREQAAAETFCATTEASWSDVEPLIDEMLEKLPQRLRECLVEHYLEGRTQQEMASRMGVNRSTVSRQLDEGIRALRSLLRAKGVQCGAGLAAVLGAGSAQAAPSSLTASLGKLAISGVGTGSSVNAGPAVVSTLLTMSTTKMVFTVAVAAALIVSPLLFLRVGETIPDKSKVAPLVMKAGGPPTAQRAKEKMHTMASSRPEPPPMPQSVRLKVDAILRRHQGLSKAEMLRTEEMSRIIDLFFVKADSDPETKRRTERARESLYETKGLPAGTGGIKLNVGDPDSPEFRAWLEAAVSDDPRHAQDWIQRRLEGAAFEFIFDPTLERSSEGISVMRPPAPSRAEK